MFSLEAVLTEAQLGIFDFASGAEQGIVDVGDKGLIEYTVLYATVSEETPCHARDGLLRRRPAAPGQGG